MRVDPSCWRLPIVALCLGATGCSVARYAVHRQSPGPSESQVGVASWYGDEFQGRPTASGQRFDARGFTAAHRSLPLGTRARVTNLANGRSVIVTINDRGPFIRGRVLDVSHASARTLGMVGSGTSRVRITPLGSAGGIGARGGSRARRHVRAHSRHGPRLVER